MNIDTLFATHLATCERILLLREVDNEMESGRFNIGSIYKHI
jgi:hypothetical protein